MARKYLLAMSAVIFVSGLVFFFWTRSESESDIAKAETMVAGMSAAEIDALYEKRLGMTFEEAKAHQRGLVNVQLGANIALAVLFAGLWFWAKSNAYMASLVALIAFLLVHAGLAFYEPRTLMQLVSIKLLFTVGLAQAVKSAHDERKLAAA